VKDDHQGGISINEKVRSYAAADLFEHIQVLLIAPKSSVSKFQPERSSNWLNYGRKRPKGDEAQSGGGLFELGAEIKRRAKRSKQLLQG
jgi:hypothetical protein